MYTKRYEKGANGNPQVEELNLCGDTMKTSLSVMAFELSF